MSTDARTLGLPTSSDDLAAAFDAAMSDPEALAAFCEIDTANGTVPFTFWPHQRDLVRLMRDNRRVICLKARQLGVSEVACIYSLWYALAHPGTLTLIISIGDREAQELLRRIKVMYQSIPPQFRKVWRTHLTKHEYQFRSAAGESRILSIPSGDSAGRGLQASLVILDEAAFYERSDQRLAALLPTFADSGQVCMISTANGMTGRFFSTWQEADDIGWARFFSGALDRPGRDEAWVAEQRKSLGDLGPQEYPLSSEESFLSTSRNVFDPADVLALKELVAEAAPWTGDIYDDASGVHCRPSEAGGWKIWEWPIAGREYMVTGDPSGGVGSSDYSAAAIYDIKGWTQVAAYHGRPDPSEFARIMRNAGWLYQTNAEEPALLVHEGNNHGQALSALFRDWSYPKVFRHRRFDLDSERESQALGWFTTAKSKPIMISSLQQAIREQTMAIRDTRFYSEAGTYLVDDKGRMEAAHNHHDDVLMSHAIAAAVLSHTEVSTELPRTPSNLRAAPFAYAS